MNSPNRPRTFSKSKLLAFLQCRKRLWLEVHRPELRDDSGAMGYFKTGYTVGDLARRLFDPEGQGELISIEKMGWETAFERTREWMNEGIHPLFEGVFSAGGGLALADVMLPVREGGKLFWDLIEVKSTTQVKDYHRDDAAIQAALIRREGWPLRKIMVAVLDREFVYPGGGDYEGIFRLEDLTDEVATREAEVWEWIAQAQLTAAEPVAPAIAVGRHCSDPFDCPFIDHCSPKEGLPRNPLSILPRFSFQRRDILEEMGITEVERVPDTELNELQLRVKEATLQNRFYWDREGSRAALEPIDQETRFLDFETIAFAIPIWAGTRPYQQVPFQFSLHTRDEQGSLQHTDFLDLSGEDPRPALVKALVEGCGESGRIYVYHAPFERRILEELARDFPEWSEGLLSIAGQLVDLCPIARSCYYHPSQRGSWSLKAVLPALCPELSYDSLEGVHHGGEAMEVFAAAIAADTSPEERRTMDRQLREYCKLDTLATVRIWEKFAGI